MASSEIATFNYINHDYIPRVDLQTLDKTFNRLETGHNEAVKAAKDLNIAISSLDMDNSEEPFKQQLYNEVTELIDNQTIYGNISNAYDDLIYKTGKLLTDPRIVGRIKSNQEKKNFDANVDQTKISDGMKQWFKDTNPYKYADGENGQMGEIWKPTRRPVDDVDMVDFMNKARQFVADERGNYQQTAFLDANGNPTSDYNQSFDGSIYYQRDGTWQKLPADKINRAIQLAIEATPGAAEAFKQNYDYQVYLHNKALELNSAPIIQGLTDNNGNILGYNKWLDGKFNEYSNLTAYNYVTNKTTYGPAKANYLKLTQNDDDDFYGGSGSSSGSGSSNKNRKVADDTFNAGTISVRGNSYESLTNVLNQCTNIVNASRSTGNRFNNIFIDGLRNTILSADEFIRRYNITDDAEKEAVYKAYEIGQDLYLNSNGNDHDNVILAQELLDNNFSNNTEDGKKIVDTLNTIKENINWFEFDIGKKLYDDYFVKDNEDLLRELDILDINIEKTDRGNAYRIHVDQDNFNILPKLRAAIANLDRYRGGNIWNGITRNLFGSQSDDNYRITASNGDTNDGPDLWGPIKNLASLGKQYKKIKNDVDSYIPSTLKNEQEYLYNVTAYNSSSAGSLFTKDSDKAKQFNDNIKNSLRNLNENSFTVYEKGKERTYTQIYNKERRDVVSTLQGALAENNKDVQINLIQPYNDGNIGFIVSFPSGSGKTTEESEKSKNGKKTTAEKIGTVDVQSEYIIFVPETDVNDNGYYNALKSQSLYTNKVDYTKNTNGDIMNLGYDQYFGDTRITASNGTLLFKNQVITNEEAVNLQAAFNILANEKRKPAIEMNYGLIQKCISILSNIYSENIEWNNAVINYLSNN